MSTGELVLLFSTMEKEGMLLPKSIVHLLRVLENTFTAQGKESIAYEGLRTRYYKPEKSTRDSLLIKLDHMRNLITRVKTTRVKTE